MPRSVRSAFLDALDVQPDPFQLQAMAALDEGRSVLVMAPTGSGKTFVADYAVARAVDAGTRAIYTTPLKALSNQKHRDLSARLGASRVGLITGDRVVNPSAPVLVVTTEVLRAMLYDGASALSTLGAVVSGRVPLPAGRRAGRGVGRGRDPRARPRTARLFVGDDP